MAKGKRKGKKEKRTEKTIRCYGDPKPTIQRLKLSRESFTVVKTSKTTNIKESYVNHFFADKHYFGNIFPLLKELKKQLDKNTKAVHDAPFSGEHKDVKYFEFSHSIKNLKFDAGTVYDIPNVIEADITKAYYRGMYLLGWIDAEFYYKCINLEKADRLILVGSIATVKTIEVYVRGTLVSTEVDFNEFYRLAWFKLCSYIDSALLSLKTQFDAISKDIFLFYWVDGIYFRDFSVPSTGYNWKTTFKELQREFGFDWEIQKMSKVILENRGNGLKIKLTKPNGDVKTFFPNKREIKLYYLDKSGRPVDVWTDLFTNTIKYN